MEVKYFNRKQGDRFSIEKVTQAIINELAKGNEVVSLEVPEIRANLRSIIKNIRYVRKHRSRRGINHITGDVNYCVIGLIGCKTVLTIHDTVLLTVKQNKISYFIKWLLWLYIPCLLADKIICISEKTKDELAKHHICTSKVRVIYDPVELLIIDFQRPLSDRVRILHVGTKPNKNLLRVIESLKGLECDLTIIGPLNCETKDLLESSGIAYKNLVGISEGELAKEYINSDIVSFPSLYEGFGMPIVEGQLGGCAVLTSNISPMTEVGKDSVYYVNPYDVESIRNGFRELIENEDLRQQLVCKGRKNAERFSPKFIADSYVKLYHELF